MHGKERKQRAVPLWKSTAKHLKKWLYRLELDINAPRLIWKLLMFRNIARDEFPQRHGVNVLEKSRRLMLCAVPNAVAK